MSDENTPKARGLNDKQEAFLNAYFLSYNATRAAKAAGYSDKTAYSIGHDLLKKPEIKEAIRARMEANAMPADEVLHHIAEIARGNISDIVDDYGNLDMVTAKALGKAGLIKRNRQRTITGDDNEIHEGEVEMYDRLKALELLAKHHHLITTNIDLTTQGEKLPTPVIYLPIVTDDDTSA